MPQDITDHDSDGSLADAVLRMPSIDEMERNSGEGEPGRPRATDGKFQAREPQKREEQKADPKAAEKVTASAEDDEDDYVELPAEEEGKEPSRHKLQELVDGFYRAKTLEAEVEKAKKFQPLPDDLESAMRETMESRAQYIGALRQFAALSRPIAPDEELINPASPKYDPEGYYKAREYYKHSWRQMQAAQQELARAEEEQGEHEAVMLRSTHARERAKLIEFWPEIAKPETVQQVRKELEKRYGIDAGTIANIYDHRFYRLAKDALKNVVSADAKNEAVKAVRAKPKLVRASARQSSSPNGRSADAFGRLQKSGSLEDAADALSGLI